MATRLYEPITSDDEFSTALLTEHQQALNAYYAADWANAESGFLSLETQTSDNIYYPLMRARVQAHRNDQNASFDGITSYTR